MNTKIFNHLNLLLFFLCSFMFTGSVYADETLYKPFILAKIYPQANLADITKQTEKALKSNGFTIVGHVTPYTDLNILIVTNDKMKQYASQSEYGAYGAIQRVTITRVNQAVQVSFTNPTYMSHAYRMATDLSDISQKLKSTLGYEKEYGSEKGLTKDDLRDYQYKWMMPDFTDRLELAEYADYKTAISKVNMFLNKNSAGVKKIYQVDIPGKKETVIGVQLAGTSSDDCSADKYIMQHIDFRDIKSSGHLPYELIVTEGNVYALYAEFRIAISFPDLSMMGSNSFASIMCAPSSIEAALTEAVGGDKED